MLPYIQMYGGGSWSSPALEGSWTLDPTRDICRMTRSAWLHHKVTFSWSRSRSQPSVNQQRRRPPSLGPGSKKGHAGVDGVSFRPPGRCCRPSSSSGGSESLADVSPRERRPRGGTTFPIYPWTSYCLSGLAANTFDLKSNLMA